MNRIFHSVDWYAIYTPSIIQGVTYISNMQNDYLHPIMLHNHDNLPLPGSLPTWGYQKSVCNYPGLGATNAILG